MEISMIRRDFIRNIANLIGLAALPVTVAAKEPADRRFLIQQCPLAGFQHHQGEALWNQLGVGNRLELVREPANPYDGNAIRIDWNGRKLGYIPRIQNQAAARLLDEGTRLEARIGRLETHSNPWSRVEVEVWLAV
jgi:hypothetical protein